MPKINIHTILKTQGKTYDYNIPAILKEEDKIVTYKEADDQHTTTSYNYKTKELTRENDSLKMHYRFNKAKNSNGTIFVKELNRTFDLQIKTKSIIQTDYNVEIDFSVEGQNFNYKIEVK